MTRLVSCLHPKVIFNKYTGEKTSVACGKCEACLNARCANWVQRLDKEANDNKYCWFVTLQYSDLDVPQVVRLLKDDNPDVEPAYIDSLTGLFVSLGDKSCGRLTKKDYQYCYDTKVLNVHDKKDAQNFIKLLRYYAKQCDPQNGKLRYFLTAEYGETTFRPHYHCLLFFNSSLLQERIVECLNRAWKHGLVFDPHPVTGSAAEYVAAYVNSFAVLPAIYKHKDLRPFSLFSKAPAIGTLQFGFKEVKDLFNSASNKLKLYDGLCNEFRDVPLWRTLRDRCFPRIQRFSSLSVTDRVILYSVLEGKTFASSERAAQWIYYWFVRRKNRKDFIAEYFRRICYVPYGQRINGEYRVVRKLSMDTLIRFCRIVSRVSAQADSYGISIKDYVIKISEFYDGIEKDSLKSWLIAQDEYFKEHDVREYLLFGKEFCDRVNNHNLDTLSSSDRYLLEFYGFVDASTKRVHLSVEDTFQYKELDSLHKKIFWDNTKTKRKNDYLFAHSDEFQNVINYFIKLDSNE